MQLVIDTGGAQTGLTLNDKQVGEGITAYH